MKNIYIYLLALLILSCGKDDRFDGQPVITFYPNVALSVTEGDNTTRVVTLQSSRPLPSDATITITVANSSFLSTVPSLVDNQLSLTMAAGTSEVNFSVAAGDDNLPVSYEAIFEITSVSGGLKDIGLESFSLFVLDNDQEAIFEDDFEGQNLSKWTTASTAGNRWSTNDFADNFYADISNFLASEVTEDWLISPEINFDNFGGEQLVFESQTRFNDGNLLEVVVLQDYTGDPTTATQTALSVALDPHRGGGFGSFTPSGIIDISQFNGTGRVAFHYKAIDDSDGSGWSVDNVQVLGSNLTGGGGTGGGTGGGGTGGGGSSSLPLSYDFENCTENFATPSGFLELFGAGSKTDRGWGCRDEGVDGSRGVRASAFGGADGFDDAWLITESAISLAGISSTYLQVDVKSAFDGLGTLKLLWSTNFTGGADPAAATWTEVSSFENSLPTKGAGEFVNIITDLSAATGNDIHIALRYVDGTSSASASFEIDNFSLTEDEPTGGSTGGGGGTGGGSTSLALPISIDFEDCTQDFTTPSLFVEAFGPGSKTDRGWGCRAQGVGDSRGVRASAFGGEAGFDDAWLITDGAVDFSGLSSATFEVDIKSAFDGPGTLNLMWSTDYSGSGDPTTANWTTISSFEDDLPVSGSDTFKTITADLSGATGMQAYIALRYEDGMNDSSASFEIDNYSISGN